MPSSTSCKAPPRKPLVDSDQLLAKRPPPVVVQQEEEPEEEQTTKRLFQEELSQEEVAERTATRLLAEEAMEESDEANPMESGAYSAPMLSEGELRDVTVPFGQVHSRLRETLHEHGFAIVTGVITPDELGRLEREFSQDMADLIDMDALAQAPAGVQAAYERFVEQGLRAFPRETAAQLARSAGFMQGRGLPQGRLAWAVRRHPNIHRIFHELFGMEEELVTSLGSSFFTPAGHPPAEQSDFNAHVDQNGHDIRPGLSERETYQGVLYVWPAGEGCTTTAVWPGSHRDVWPLMMQDHAFMEAGTYGFHYCEVAAMHHPGLARLLASGWARHARRCVIPAGSLLLWNSKTMHTGWKGGPRLAQTVCFEPARRRPEAERLSKLRLVALGLPSCHWASACMQHDLCLGEPGSFAEFFDVASTPAEDAADPEQVVLPLRPALYSRALATGADLERLMQLVDVEYRPGLVGMWDADAEAAELLEASVVAEYKRHL